MTSFSEIFKDGKPRFSLEFFPPKTPDKLSSTISTIDRCAKMQPDFMTCTYGAGGGTRELTGQIVRHMVQASHGPAVAHLTCVGHSVDDVSTVLDHWKSLGISMILALRGDPPKGTGSFEAHPEGFSCARDLVSHIKSRGDFSIAVAGYPEVHPEALSLEAEMKYLREKVDAGAEVVITQLFFDPTLYDRFLERATKAGITVPIVPGIMPIGNVKQVERFTSMCGASIPATLQAELEVIKDDLAAVREFGVAYAQRLCVDLLKRGAPGIHLYTLNKYLQVDSILTHLIDYRSKL